MDRHIDMNAEIREVLERRQNDLAWRAIVQGDQSALRKLSTPNQETQQKMLAKIERERKDLPFGQRQVQSFLRFMVSAETERALEDAEGDHKVYDALGEHRVLGRAKKKKSRVVNC